ncbi:hypothetical protein GALL_348160 [mine drainage metagenome]|jgi:hypothetical protein|uniref:Uncharacterized protein n=1 Tax=mine drainage metagenome TaxID=410659 RepID=A0A1J5QIS4_9ZZZZ
MHGHWTTALFAAWLTLQAWMDLRLWRDAGDAPFAELADPFVDG